MEKMLKAMLNAQKEVALEENALLVELWAIVGALQEATEILHDLISKGEFEEAKGFLNDCSKLQQRQEELETLLENKQSHCAVPGPVAVDDVAVHLLRRQVAGTEGGECPPQPCALVQQIDLRP